MMSLSLTESALWALLEEQFLTSLGLKADIEFGISRSAAIAASRGLKRVCSGGGQNG